MKTPFLAFRGHMTLFCVSHGTSCDVCYRYAAAPLRTNDQPSLKVLLSKTTFFFFIICCF